MKLVHAFHVTFFLLLLHVAAAQGVVINQAITEEDVLAAQQGWCEALTSISATYASDGFEAAQALAGDIIDAAYGYQMGAVLFKPTLTTYPQTFRITREGALSYFVGGNPDFPDDFGFALQGWVGCEVDNAAVFITGESATTMGNVHLRNDAEEVTTVDKTWKFVRDDVGALRIVTHHSSLPFAAN